jgi:hypothetical protein
VLASRVAVVEALRVGRQVTGRSTAKITSQHSLIYGHLIETRGIDQAQCCAEANRSGAAWLGILQPQASGPSSDSLPSMFGQGAGVP